MDEERNNGNSFDRPKVQGNWKCATCSKAISELPFQPREGQEVFCRECYSATRNSNRPNPNRSRVQGNWQCADCGTSITELPFQPAGGRPIYCADCYRNSNNRSSR